ncbi:hypothetical protein GCWU000324_02955 [Kingella oralis ATCC 51147]|uniref:Uncharacterized protein n=1 Tax=Kingella oralis ATCC 51147 TaxID=629741 RepID=C4GMM2_9NEIS|nr:hypothetical protein GCWU000324_02955 [Kingella oralis ATCC 51147]
MKMQHAKQHQHGNRQRNQKRLACVVACGGGAWGNGGGCGSSCCSEKKGAILTERDGAGHKRQRQPENMKYRFQAASTLAIHPICPI